ncbi:MAG: hypothetical protein JXA28_10585 [Bacteroidetes bacterium]|nr:hypothetical protein [Bacteroidota bacterium]
MAGHEFIHFYETNFFDCDARQRLSIPGMLRFFEDIALRQSEAVGAGLEFYAREQVAWLLSRWDIRIHAQPRYMDRVLVLTQPMEMRRILANRRYLLSDTAGATAVEADSQWVFMDTERKRPARIPEEVFQRYGIAGESGDVPVPRDPREPEGSDEIRRFSVRMGDIDSNGHVNNIRYVEWALEALPPDMQREAVPVRLLVQYRKEVLFGTMVRAVTELKEEEGLIVGLHEIRSGESVVCQIESQWRRPSSIG